jgi:hypothetical protein
MKFILDEVVSLTEAMKRQTQRTTYKKKSMFGRPDGVLFALIGWPMNRRGSPGKLKPRTVAQWFFLVLTTGPTPPAS